MMICMDCMSVRILYGYTRRKQNDSLCIFRSLDKDKIK